MTTRVDALQRWLNVLAIAITVLAFLGRGGAPPQDLQVTLNRLGAGETFDFVSWTLEALARKTAYSLLAPQRFLTDEQQSRLVLEYLDDIREANRLSGEIDRIYTDPNIVDPDAVSQAPQEAYAVLRQRMARRSPIAEAILESQIEYVLSQAELGWLAAVLPPVRGAFTPLPHILIVSPRKTIESVYQRQLVAGLTAAEQAEIEARITEVLPDYSAYVTRIGGLASYPAMLLESSSIAWVADVLAHEWTHHYLSFYPLGWYYMRSGETRTINETTATLMGEWAGQEVLLRFYEPLVTEAKALPSPLAVEPHKAEADAERFDFRAEMRDTRVVVDRLLAENRIVEAEWYMEARRRYFVANGYRLRRLNQAYFAFHGAYASGPGAAGADPIGPLVQRAWALSETPGAFLRRMAPITSLQELRLLVDS